MHRTIKFTSPSGRQLVWNGEELPLAVPLCGFENDKCKSGNVNQNSTLLDFSFQSYSQYFSHVYDFLGCSHPKVTC